MGRTARLLILAALTTTSVSTAAVRVARAADPLPTAPTPAAPTAPTANTVVADRVALRFVTPETGGSAHPRFFTERELAFFARIEALLEQTPLESGDYPERYVRAAADRLVARAMLASLMVQRGVEPPDLPKQTIEARTELEARVGQPALVDAMKRESIEEDELLVFLRDQVRATYYVDRAITPILVVNEDSLREAFRATLNPFRGGKFDDVRPKLRRWLVTERLRAAEIEFLQSARTRIKVTPTLFALTPPPPPSPPVVAPEPTQR